MTSAALLVMDVQEGIVGRFGDPRDYLDRMSAALAAARAARIPVVYVVVGFRPGHPEVSARNKVFAALASADAFSASDPAARVHPGIAPEPQDMVVTKRRVSAFGGSDLDVLLRGLGADTLVLSGIATSGVVLSTLRQAADLDYSLVVLADGCLDADQDVHRVLTEKVFPRQADVLTIEQWTSGLGRLQEPEPIPVRPVGWVSTARADLTDDQWGEVPAVITLAPGFGADALAGLADFSHLEVIYQFHRVTADEVERGARHPRENKDWPLAGIFAQRGKNRPNRIGPDARVLLMSGAGPGLVDVLTLERIEADLFRSCGPDLHPRRHPGRRHRPGVAVQAGLQAPRFARRVSTPG
jgi:nicotinamidase-related amidase/tRNA (Thr-GGU) A37 N-methylase